MNNVSSKTIAWSWSRLQTFEECPKKFYHINIKKDVPFPDSPALQKGRDEHKALEQAVIQWGGGSIHPDVIHMAPFIQQFCQAYDEVTPEMKITLTEDLHTTDWRDWDGAWCRSALDLVGVKGDTAAIVDWKTGKPWPDGGQLKLNAGALMAADPRINKVTTAYIYIHHQQSESKTYTREQFEDIWGGFRERAGRIQVANVNNDWPAKQNRFCGRCPVPKSKCPFKPE